MTPPILLMLATPTLPPGWHPIPGAAPPRGFAEALALVARSFLPFEAPNLTEAQREAFAKCIPPVSYAPERTEISAEAMRDYGASARFSSLWFPTAALSLVRRHHPGVRWAPGGADEPPGLADIDLLHGWAQGRCVAVVCRLAMVAEAGR